MTELARSSNRTLRIVSKCATKAEFVAVFRRLVTDDAVFIATRKPKSQGETVRFRITLSDSTPMLVGQGKVIFSDADGTGPFGRPGMQIALSQLDDSSRTTLSLLQQKAPAAAPRKIPAPGAKAPAKKTLFAAMPPIPAVPAKNKSAKVPKTRALPPLLKPEASASTSPTTAPIAAKPSPSPKSSAVQAKSLGAAPIASDPLPAKVSPQPLKKPPSLPANDWLSKPKSADREPEAAEGTQRSPERSKRPTHQRFVASGTPPPILAKATPKEPIAKAPEEVDDSWGDDTVRVGTDSDGEERAKGSEYILPANPFGELANESLEAFIECTLYEETGTFVPIREDSEATETGHTPIPNWWPGGKTPPPVFDRSPAIADETTVTQSLAELVRGHTDVAPNGGVQSSAPLPLQPPAGTEPPGPPRFPPPQPLMPPQAQTQAPQIPNAAVPPRAPVMSAVPEVVAVDATALIDTRPLWKRTAVIVGSTPVFSLVAGYLLWGGGADESDESAAEAPALSVAPKKDKTQEQSGEAKSRVDLTSKSETKKQTEPEESNAKEATKTATDEPTTATTKTEPPKPTTDAPEESTKTEPPVEPSEAEINSASKPALAATSSESNQVLANGECNFSFTTRPKGASIYLAGTKLGVTPFEAAVPCGEQNIVIKRSRYVDIKRTINTAEDKALKLRLERPTHTLRVVSKPAGATVYVYGRRIGRTPTRTKVQGFERIPIKLVRKGYKPYSTRRYMRRAKTTVSVALTKKRPTRRTRRTRRRATKRGSKRTNTRRRTTNKRR